MLSKKDKAEIEKLITEGASTKQILEAMPDKPIVEIKTFVEGMFSKSLARGAIDGKRVAGVVCSTQTSSEIADAHKKIINKNGTRYSDCITEIKK